jgi:hypothetical protein
MDEMEKTAVGVIIFVCLLVLIAFGLGAWAFVEIIQALTD